MIFDEIDALYTEIDNFLAMKEFQARSLGLEVQEFDAQLRREMNDQSYFLFIFTRLEERIKALSDNLIIGKNASVTDVKDRNSWSIVKKHRLDLMERVAFFTPNTGGDYNLIYNYKKKRDKVAHGNYAAGINIPTILVDMKRLYNDLDT